MSVSLATSVYTAGHGYGWSSVPDGIAAEELEKFLEEARALRPDFAAEDAVTTGVLVRGGYAAAFTIRRATGWDSVGRAADYAAFAFVPCKDAAAVDFAALLTDAFFAVPTHTPPTTLSYEGAPSAAFPVDAPGRLLCQNRLENIDLRAAGALLARYGTNADSWIFRADRNGTFTLTTTPWHK